MIEAIVDRVAQQAIDPWSREVESLPTSLVVARRRPARPAARRPTVRAECEMAPELLRTGIM